MHLILLIDLSFSASSALHFLLQRIEQLFVSPVCEQALFIRLWRIEEISLSENFSFLFFAFFFFYLVPLSHPLLPSVCAVISAALLFCLLLSLQQRLFCSGGLCASEHRGV